MSYRVEQDDPGCTQCGQGATWNVIDPTGAANGTSWMDRGTAEEQCDDLNRAYILGAQSGPSRLAPIIALYERTKHLDAVLSDPVWTQDEWEDDDTLGLHHVLYDCWRAIKVVCEERK